MTTPEKITPNPKEDIVQIAERLLSQQRKANQLARELNAKNEIMTTPWGEKLNIFHDVFVIGSVEPWCPNDKGGKHIGWAIYSTTPTVHLEELREIPLKLGDTIAFEDIGNITPEVGDIIHFHRRQHKFGRWLSVEVIKD